MAITERAKASLSKLWKRFLKLPLQAKIIVIILLALVLWLAIPRLFAGKQQPQYQTAQAQTGTLISSISESGTISSGNSVQITTQATGTVNEVYVQNGDSVTAGEKIADIALDQNSQQKQSSAWASYLQTQNALNSAQAQLNSLQAAEFTANQAFMNGAVAKGLATTDPEYIEENATWLQAEANYKNQAGQITQAQAALNSAWLAYQQISSTITAPASGVITNLTITQGLPISSNSTGGNNSTNSTNSNTNSNSTQSLGTITLGQGSLQAVVNATEIDITKAKIGQKVTMTLDAFPGKTFTGTVSSINTNGTVSSGVTTYPITITFDSPDSNIYPNMSVTANIITSVENNVLLVPSSAIQTLTGQTTVRILKNGKVQSVPVTTGASNDTQTAVTSGLQNGETVVTGVLNPTTPSTTTGSSPFSGTGFGGLRGGFGGGGGRIIQRSTGG